MTKPTKLKIQQSLQWTLDQITRDQLVWFDPTDCMWVCLHCEGRHDESAHIAHKLSCPYRLALEALR